MTEVNMDLVDLDVDEIRELESAWMTEQMKCLGMSNSRLHERLVAVGFTGRVNNITMWKTSRTSIPHEWLVDVVRLLASDEPEPLIVEMYSKRFPYLRPYFKDVEKVVLDLSSDSARDSDNLPQGIYYIPKSGIHQGIRFVPHRNRKGFFQGGISRFSKDIEEFESFEALWHRISVDPEFKVRMAPEDKRTPPSLIRKDSLVIEW